MRSVRILTIVVLALSFIIASGRVSGAEPMGTAFTYQGRLIEAGYPAEGEYDFQFEVYDEPTDGNQLNGTIEANEVEVSDGYFTVVLDFGAGVFDGDARWLDIGVRHGVLEDPNSYAPLDPRQEVMPTPYALYAETAGGDADWIVDGNDMYAIPPGNVGIGTTSPATKLEVSGDIRLTSAGTISSGGDITIDAAENILIPSGDTLYFQGTHFGKIWAGMTSMNVYSQDSPLKLYTGYGDSDIVLDPAGGDVHVNANVGIGTAGPATKLHVYEPSPTDVFMSVEASSSNAEAGVRLTNPAGGWDVFANDNNGDFGISYALSDRVLTIKQTTGNVGIGTESPAATVDVNGTLAVENGPPINEISTDGTLDDNSDSAVPTEQAVKTYVDAQIGSGSVGVVPIGGIIAWHKSFPNTPSLPDGWVECNGQTLSDSQSDYDGQVMPNLNGASGTQRFLRGSTTSGTTGGSETHSHTLNSDRLTANGDQHAAFHGPTRAIPTSNVSSLPSYYEVVWIMKVK